MQAASTVVVQWFVRSRRSEYRFLEAVGCCCSCGHSIAGGAHNNIIQHDAMYYVDHSAESCKGIL